MKLQYLRMDMPHPLFFGTAEKSVIWEN